MIQKSDRFYVNFKYITVFYHDEIFISIKCDGNTMSGKYKRDKARAKQGKTKRYRVYGYIGFHSNLIGRYF